MMQKTTPSTHWNLCLGVYLVTMGIHYQVLPIAFGLEVSDNSVPLKKLFLDPGPEIIPLGYRFFLIQWLPAVNTSFLGLIRWLLLTQLMKLGVICMEVTRGYLNAL